MTGIVGRLPRVGRSARAPLALRQFASFETGDVATGTALIPFDDTKPLIGEGTQFMVLPTFTPRFADSKMIVDVVFNGSYSVSVDNMTAALFRDAVSEAVGVGHKHVQISRLEQINFRTVYVPGTRTPIDFQVRAGGGTTGELTFNGVGGLRRFGGALASSITVMEIAP